MSRLARTTSPYHSPNTFTRWLRRLFGCPAVPRLEPVRLSLLALESRDQAGSLLDALFGAALADAPTARPGLRPLTQELLSSAASSRAGSNAGEADGLPPWLAEAFVAAAVVAPQSQPAAGGGSGQAQAQRSPLGPLEDFWSGFGPAAGANFSHADPTSKPTAPGGGGSFGAATPASPLLGAPAGAPSGLAAIQPVAFVAPSINPSATTAQPMTAQPMTAQPMTTMATPDYLSGGSGGGVWITADQDAVEQNPSSGYFTVHRIDSTGSLTVNYAPPTGTATPGSDYTGIAAGGGSVTFTAGQTTVPLFVDPVNDGIPEPTETVTVSLSSGAGYSVSPSGGSATLSIYDSGGGSGGNGPPVAVDDGATTPAGQAVTIAVLANDSDPDNDPLTIQSYTQGAQGSVSLSGSSLVYTPNSPNWIGTDSFTYTISDGHGHTDTATVTITINAQTVWVTADQNASEDGPTSGYFTVHRNDSVGGLTVSYAAPTGTATDGSDYSGIAAGGGSVDFIDGQTAVTVSVNPVDDTLDEGAETVTLALTGGAGYTVGNPSSATLNIADNDRTIVWVERVADAAEQGVSGGQFAFHRSGGGTGPLTVNYTAPGGTATAGADYTSPTSGAGTVSFASGQTVVYLDVIPVDDNIPEATETVNISVASGAGYYPSGGAATVNILDNDPLVWVDRDRDANEQGAASGRFAFHRFGGGTAALTVNYTAPGGTATLPDDYSGPAATGGTVSFAAGQAVAYVNVLPVDDSIPEPTETVTLGVASGSGYTVSGGAAAVNILDNDTLVWIEWAKNAYEQNEQKGRFAIERFGGGTDPLTVYYNAPGGTAIPNSDYRSPTTAGSVSFTPGQTVVYLDVDPIDDTVADGDQTVVISLSASGGYSGGSGGGSLGYQVSGGADTATVTIVDNDGGDSGGSGGSGGGNGPPAAINDTATTTVGQAVTVAVLANDADPDNDPLTIQSYTQAGQGSVSLSGSSLVYTPNSPNWTGTDSFAYTINDGQGHTDSATVTVTVSAPISSSLPPVYAVCQSAVCAGPIISPPAGADGPQPSASSPKPVRYADGVALILASDLESDGLGGGWGQSRTWSNNSTYATGSALGNGWVTTQQPHLSRTDTGLVLLADATTAYYYDGQGTPDADGNYPSYTPRFTNTGTITYDSANQVFVVNDGSGSTLRFSSFASSYPAAQQGALASRIDPDGTATTVTSRDTAGRPTEVQISATVAGVMTTESYRTTYLPDGDPNAGRIASVTLRRQENGGPWQTVRAVAYEYYPAGDSNGNLGDLKRATVTDASSAVLDQTYYRYYTEDTYDANFYQIGYQGGLKYAIGSAGYAQLKAAVGGSDASVDAASDTAISPYADNYFEYDSLHRVTKETASGQGCSACAGGQGTYTYSYTTSNNPDGYNSWETKTVETQPDGSTNTVYTNAYGQVMLSAHAEGSQSWDTYYRYAAGSSGGSLSGGHLVLEAQSSAVTGYDDQYADLVHDTGGNAQYLSDSTGLFDIFTYYTTTTATASVAGGVAGFLEQRSLRQGELGSDIPQEAWSYYQVTASGATTTPEASDTVYRNTDGTGAETTNFSYAWYAGTTQAYSVTTTLPTVTAAENGPGTAASSTVVFDTDGRPIWTKDAAGFLTYTEYDPATGAVVKSITDVDTSRTGDFANLPAGWSTPSGGGLHLITLDEVDSLGRTTKMTDPLGRVTYTVYDDANYEVRTYAGWDDTNHVPTGPTVVSREDRAGRYSETLSMSATPALDGNGRPTGTEAISNLQSLSRSYANGAGQVIYSDDYFNLSGLTYSTSATLGTEGTNFYRTRQDYDHLGRPNRTVSPAGTITRTVYDGQGRVVSEWIGTDDTPTSGYWSPENLAGTDMVKIRDYEYDNGGVGDGNVTQVTEYPGLGAANRVTETWYDWRDRAVANKAGVQATEDASVNRPLSYTEYDNLGEAVSTELYDGDAVTLTTTNGVPDRPAASLLRAKTTTAYDEQGRAYQTSTYSVDPATGAVSTSALVANTWFNLRGNAIKSAMPGGLVQKTVYDGAGRATTVYTSDGGGDASWSDAGNVTNDTVLEQTETQYDAASEPILSTTRQRFHNASGTGALGTPTSGIAARVSYSTAYYDLAGRMVASVDVGTNGGVAYTRPTTVPGRSDTALVTSETYDAAGRVYETTDPRGLVTRTLYDALGRTTKTIEDYVDGVPSDNDDKTTEYGYDSAGMTSLTLDLTGGGVQTTAWLHGVSLASGSAINSNDSVRETDWPDPTTGAPSSSQKDTVTVNALGQTATSTDRNGTTHALDYDVLGRETDDAVTLLGVNVDGAVRRIETAYDSQGNPYQTTSYDAASGGNIVNQVQRDFNGLGQLTSDWQEHTGTVNGSTPRVQYAYNEMSGGVNNSRQISMTYPNGRVIDDNYATGLDDSISRLSSLSDSSATLESYAYLGLGTLVLRSHPQPGVDLTYIKQSGENNGDAGDQYIGLDRFSRVVDQRWIVAATGVATDRFQYGYDRDSNRTYRDNLVNTSFNETYGYDGLNQIVSFQRANGHSQGWDYDAAGNFNSVTTDSTQQTRTANAQNQITSISGATTPTFDAAGNMTSDETGKQFVYDAWNRLVAVKDSSGNLLERLAYDGLNRRVSQAVSGTTTDLYYSQQWQVLEERVSGVATTQYVWSPAYVNALVERDRDTNGDGTLDERLYAQQDANYNTTALTDSSGNVVERYVYDSFGQRTVLNAAWTVITNSGVDWLLGYQGMRHDSISNLDEANRRWHSEVLMRWTTTDPILFTGGDGNLYRFVGNGPENGVDPTGLQKLKLVGNLVAEAVETIAGKYLKKTGNGLTFEEAVNFVRNGGDVLARDRGTAKRIAEAASNGGSAILETEGKLRKGALGRTHYHPGQPGNRKAHVYFYSAAPPGLLGIMQSRDCEHDGLRTQSIRIVDQFVNPVYTLMDLKYFSEVVAPIVAPKYHEDPFKRHGMTSAEFDALPDNMKGPVLDKLYNPPSIEDIFK